jgi:hypothetical protein
MNNIINRFNPETVRNYGLAVLATVASALGANALKGSAAFDSVAHAQTTGNVTASSSTTSEMNPLTPDCMDEAFGINDENRATYNPAHLIGSFYVGKSKRKLEVRAQAPDVPEECEPIIESRTITVDQLYKGEDNTPVSAVFTGLGEIDDSQTITTARRFQGIRGPKVRGYHQLVNITVRATDGSEKQYTGRELIRGRTDGI